MKISLVASVLIAGMTASKVHADSARDLQNRLNKVNSFYATFIQKITSAEGEAFQESQGELWLKRPNLFNWKTTIPDESVLISDGKTLWFYNPFLEQVTAICVKDATGNTPFMLITRNDAITWKQYKVLQHGDNFELTPKTANGNLSQIVINVNSRGIIKSFSATEKDGQYSNYILQNHQNGAVDSSKFTFMLPKGVTIDDQRQ
ncbi:MAG: outer membrane lipoprotein chaperone LolA [Candidatus Malihini olakiniferum]